MSPKKALLAQLVIMSVLIALAALFPGRFVAVLKSRPGLYLDIKLLHVLTATLFFGNVVIGTIWETKSLLSERIEVVRYTYRTVAWLDAFFTAPLILIATLSGLALGTMMGGVFSMGWLTLAFGLFVLSGVVWVVIDIPTQRRVKSLFANLPAQGPLESEPLVAILRFRLKLNVLAILPLLGVLYLMVQKPEIRALDPGARHGESGCVHNRRAA